MTISNITGLTANQLIPTITAINQVFLGGMEDSHDDAVRLFRVLRDQGVDAFWEAHYMLLNKDDVAEGEKLIDELGIDAIFGDLYALMNRNQPQS